MGRLKHINVVKRFLEQLGTLKKLIQDARLTTARLAYKHMSSMGVHEPRHLVIVQSFRQLLIAIELTNW